MLKSTFGRLGLQRCRWQYGSFFNRLAVVDSQICEIPQNSELIRGYLDNLIDLVVKRLRICIMQLPINSNFERISYRFRDIDV